MTELQSLLNQITRFNVQRMRAYTSARSISSDAEIFLDANENPWSPTGEDANRYPEPQPSLLTKKISELYNVTPSQLLMGRGSDEMIDLLIRAFCKEGENSILVCPPTYGVYQFYAELQGASVAKAALTPFSFELDAEGVNETVDRSCRKISLVFLCTPNNPTGNRLSNSEIEKVLNHVRDQSLVVIDEAYLEFSDAASWTQRLEEFPHLVVLRTLSKAWGLAGMRCGAAIAHPEIISILKKIQAPYPISSIQAKTILDVLNQNASNLDETVLRIRSIRESLITELKRREGDQVLKVFPSESNFILVQLKDADPFVEFCRSRRILIRNRGTEPGLENCVRISVGSQSEIDSFLMAFKEFYGLS